MNQLLTAKLRLTFWYTLTLMVVSLFLSTIYYQKTVAMIEVQYKQIEIRLNDQRISPFSQQRRNLPQRLELLTEDLELIRSFLVRQLLFINAMVFVIGGAVSYFLAGKTLKPIQVSLEQQKQFIGDAAHELRTPLTALKTSLEVGLMDKKINSVAKKLLKSNLADVNSLTALTENLLSLARLDSEDFVFSFTVIELEKIINRVLQHLKPLSEQKKIKIKVSGLNNQTVLGNENALVEAVMVLVDNAIKYSNKKSEIKIKVKTQKNNLILQIIDQGIGIDKKHLAQIFARFYRVDEARTKGERHGYGLGLALAKKIIDQHGAKIKVTSELGRGSVFTLIF
ncbi:MAG: sensor histidine kinase [Patescibacteria group bacterium]